MSEIEIFPDLDSLAQAAAERFSALAREAVAGRGQFLVCLSGGSTPLAMYRLLAGPRYCDNLPWDKMIFLWGDERLVPPDDPQSNYGQAWKTLLGRVAVRAENVVRVRGELPAAEAAAAYAAELRRLAGPSSPQPWPRLDLVLLGLGSDGHTASLFPGSDPAQGESCPVLAVSGDYQGRPAARVTLAPAVFNTARQVIFLVAGGDKAIALTATLGAARDPRRWPAQRIQPAAGRITWLVDAAARGEPNPQSLPFREGTGG